MIIFDLGGVLLQEAEVNMSTVLPANLDIERIDGKPPKIFYRMFDFIDLIFSRPCKKDWFLGVLSGDEIVQKIKECIDKEEFSVFFKNKQEKNLIKYGSEFILSPDKNVPLTSLNQQGFEFVKRCNKNGMRIMILSNWDPISFVKVQNKFSELFNLFKQEDIVIPAHVGFVKPEAEVYLYMIKKLNIDTANTFFIDDSAKNVAAAQMCGLKGVVHYNWERTELDLMLNGLGMKDGMQAIL